jgi:hypothetical protein
VSLRFAWQRMRIAVLVLGAISLGYAVFLIATLPTL